MTVQTYPKQPDNQASAMPSEIDWTRGWRYEVVITADGQRETIRVPLTPEEILHPQEGFVMPERTDHDRICDDLRDMLRAWALNHPAFTIFHNLVFAWDKPGIGDYAPDIAVVPNVRDPEADRGKFFVANEGTRPALAIEVVSPISRKADRETKVTDYAQVGIAEYIYIDCRRRKRGIVSELAGFRLEDGLYQPLALDEDGAVYMATLGLRFGINGAKAWIEDVATGEDLLDHWATAQALRQTQAQLQQAEQQLVALNAEMLALRAGRQ
ncbi:MAG: Uma2 family endonuclease [Caldilineaceae bacterium]